MRTFDTLIKWKRDQNYIVITDYGNDESYLIESLKDAFGGESTSPRLLVFQKRIDLAFGEWRKPTAEG